MKRKIGRWLGLAIAPAAALALFAASPANASDYSGDCAGVTAFNGTGNVSISDSNCTLPVSITATGSITINATSVSGSGKNLTAGTFVDVTTTGGDIEIGAVTSNWNTELLGESVTAGNITSNWGVEVTATDGTLDLKDIKSNNNNSSFGGNVLLTATGNIKTEDIKNGGTTTTGGIEIHANTDGTTTVFNIGGGTANGTGILDVSNTTGGGSDQGYLPAGVYVTNGKSDSIGGITVNSMSSLVLTSSGGRAALLILDAKSGTLTLPSGTLNAGDSTATYAGTIYLLADTLNTADGTIITASQDDSATGTYHYVAIAASTINVSGTTGLEIKADGDGVNGANASGFSAIMPKGSISITSTSIVNNLLWSVATSAYTTDGPLTVSGNGNIKLTATGDYTRSSVSGNGITFDNYGDVVIEAKGKAGDTIHEVLIAYYGDPAGTDLTFSNSGNVTLDASATEDGYGGEVNILTHKFAMNKEILYVKADGPTTGDGDGGEIFVNTSWDAGAGFQLNSSAAARFSANATSDANGEGDAVYSDLDVGGPKAITLWAGGVSLKLGTGYGQVTFSAKGGAGGGNGGAVVTTASNIQLMTDNAVDVSALAGDSSGGNFQWYTNITLVNAAVTNPMILAKSHGNAAGGKIKGYHVTSFDVNSYFKVEGGDDVDGGSISLNDVTCHRWQTGYSYPESYWNCVNPDSPVALDQVPANQASSLPNNIPSNVFNTVGTTLYVMTNPAQFGTFFGSQLGGATAAFTFSFYSQNEPVYTAVFQSAYLPALGQTTFSEDWLRSITTHEIGHSLDVFYGFESDQYNTTYIQAIQEDAAYLNSANGGNPCGVGGPFEGLIDLQSRQPFCDGSGNLNNPGGIYTGMSNAEIAFYSSRNLGEGDLLNYGHGFVELYAQVFAYRGFNNTLSHPSGYYDPTADGLMYKGYFQCAQAYAAAILGQTYTPAYSCSP